MKKLLFIALSLITFNSFAQKNDKIKYSKEELKEMNKYLFEEVFKTVSPKKTSTIILKNGQIFKGYCRDVDRKKGQIYHIEIKDSVTGKELKFEATEIAELYLFPSNFEKGLLVQKHFSTMNNWGRKDLKKSSNKEDIYFKNQKVSLKNKHEEKEYLLQLINPEFNSIIEVYGDPNAKETTTHSFGVNGMMSPGIGGGIIKSYYIKKGEEIIWLHKDEFKENYTKLFGDSKEFMDKYPYESIKWDFLSFLIFEYTRIKMELEKN